MKRFAQARSISDLITDRRFSRHLESHRQMLRTRCLHVLVLSFILITTACSDSAERVWLKAPGWSRAQQIGHTLVGEPVPFALDDAGRLYFFLVRAQQDNSSPQVIAMNREMKVVWDHTYDIASSRLTQPQILWSKQGLELFWISDEHLYYARLDPSGNAIGEPMVLSSDVPVDSYALARNAAGFITVWYASSRRNPSLYALSEPLDAGTDQINVDAILIDANGVRPQLQFDPSGTLHASWAHYPPGYGDNRLFYAAYPDGAVQPGKETDVFEPRLGTATNMRGPRLGLDQHQVYIFWTQVSLTGTQTGLIETFYVHFLHGEPYLALSAERLFIPSDYDLVYSSFPHGDLEAGDRVAWESWRVSNINDIATNSTYAQELSIIFRGHIDYLRHKTQGQIGTTFLQDGAPVAYQLLSFTPVDSTDPAILSDQAGRLYATWLEKGAASDFTVYFASTALDIHHTLDTLNWRDAGRLGAETLFGLLGGVLLIPFILLWMVGPLVIMGLTTLAIRQDNRLRYLIELASLILALIAYWASKLMTLPGIREYVPFSAWLPIIPSWLNGPLRWGVPCLFCALGLAVAWNYTYRRSNPSRLLFGLIFAAVDGGLSIAVYGVLFYGGA